MPRRLPCHRFARLALSLLGATLAGTLPAAAAPKVVVTIKPLYALVAGVMAGVGRPQMLVKGSASPHLYALKPSDLAALHGADLVFRASTATEPFSVRLTQALPRQVGLVTLQEAPGVALLARRTGVFFESGGTADGHVHGADAAKAFDGHIWLDPDNAKAMVDRIEQALSAKDPANAEVFKTNAATLKRRLDGLGAELQRALEPLAGKAYIVAHDAFQYLERRYSLNVVGAISLSPELPPSAKRLGELRRKILSLGAICVFAEPHLDKRLIDNLTEGTSARTGTLDPEGFALEPEPDLYFTLMRKLAADLRACLLPPA
jgi:zinc transport system substrate-binding protein